MNTALIIAGGIGSRVGNEIPKQFLTVNEVPIIIYTLKVFQNHKGTDRIIVVCLSGWHEVLKAYCKQFGITKLEAIIKSGTTRFESMYNGIKYLERCSKPDDLITIHDSNRPLVFSDVIDKSQKCASQYGNALAIIQCNDAMFTSHNRFTAESHVDKKIIFQGQTPETFKFSLIHEVCEKALADNAGDLSSSALLIKYNHKVYLSEGSTLNFKITTSEDLDIFKALLKSGTVNSLI